MGRREALLARGSTEKKGYAIEVATIHLTPNEIEIEEGEERGYLISEDESRGRPSTKLQNAHAPISATLESMRTPEL